MCIKTLETAQNVEHGDRERKKTKNGTEAIENITKSFLGV